MNSRAVLPGDVRGRGQAKATRLRFGFVKRFRRNDDGSTAVEFAFVSVPFFALLFAIIETALVFWTNQVLETAVADASRTLYTGQFQRANGALEGDDLRDAFRDTVCARVVALFDCAGGLRVDVRAFADFGAVSLPSVLNDEGAVDPTAFVVQSSAERQVVILRAAIEYPVFVNLLGGMKGDLANGRRLIMATAAFRNEPFGQP